jgi:hypothetical protein
VLQPVQPAASFSTSLGACQSRVPACNKFVPAWCSVLLCSLSCLGNAYCLEFWQALRLCGVRPHALVVGLFRMDLFLRQANWSSGTGRPAGSGQSAGPSCCETGRLLLFLWRCSSTPYLPSCACLCCAVVIFTALFCPGSSWAKWCRAGQAGLVCCQQACQWSVADRSFFICLYVHCTLLLSGLVEVCCMLVFQ